MTITGESGPSSLCDSLPSDSPSFSRHTSCTSTIAQHRETRTQTGLGLLMPDKSCG